MINIPKDKRASPLVDKICSYCGCPYKGIAISKYCIDHRGTKEVKTPVEVENNNIEYNHTYRSPVTIQMHCALCHAAYNITVYPKQFTYPKYCPQHRNKFQRGL